MASASSQRHSVVVEMLSTSPVAMSSARNSPRLQRPSGTPRVAGSSQAIALAWATTAAANTRGRPGRFRSRRPANPSWKKRLRHLLTVFGATPTRRAISVFERPAAVSRTILARITSRHGAAWQRARALRKRRSAARKLIGNGLRPPARATHASSALATGRAGGYRVGG
jgi:hypothetical protein